MKANNMAIFFLIGARGSGKTTIGKRLAEMLNYEWLDLDEQLCAQAEQPISAIVQKYGWNYFRDLESRVLDNIIQKYTGKEVIISTGGGIVLDASNREKLRKNGYVIWLDVPATHLYKRLAENPDFQQRPALTENTMLEEIGQVLAERLPLYKACAHIHVDGTLSPDAICTHIRKCGKNLPR